MENVGDMRIFVAGATGVIGVRLVPLLSEAGHDVAGMTRSPHKADMLRALGAQPVVCDAYDAAALTDAVVAFRPDTLLHHVTDLPDERERIPERRAAHARVLREGTRNLLSAAAAADTGHIVAQSIAWQIPGEVDDAYTYLERSVLDAGGVVVRYGQFYGPGTYNEDTPPSHPRVHVDDAATRTLQALDAPSGVIEITEK